MDDYFTLDDIRRQIEAVDAFEASIRKSQREPAVHDQRQQEQQKSVLRTEPALAQMASKKARHTSEPSQSIKGVQQSQQAHQAQQVATQRRRRGPNKPPRACLCGINHLFLDCPYIIPSIQPQGWQPDPQILVYVHD